MHSWLEPLLSNAIAATVLAVAAAAVMWFRPRPAMRHALWLIVLLKFITPPVIPIRVPMPVLSTDRTAHGRDPDHTLNGARKSIVLAAEQSHLAEFGDRDGLALDALEEDTGTDVALTAAPQVDVEVDALRSETIVPPDETDYRPVANPGADAPGSPVLTVVLLAVWATGSATWFVLAGLRLARFHHHAGQLRPAGAELQRIADDVAARLRLPGRLHVRVTDAAVPPMLAWLFGRGTILLPGTLLRELAPEQQAAIIAHELAHYRRGDHWLRWIEFVVIGIYWWHPAAWLARRQLHQAEELCCDAWVLRVFPDRAKGYAQALLATVDFLADVRTPAPAGACGFGHVHALQRRLEMILKRTTQPDLSSAARVFLVVLAVGILPLTPRAFSQSDRPGLAPTRSSDAVAVTDVAPTAPVELPIVAPAGSQPPAAPGIAPTAANSEPERKLSTEERLDRLEALIQRLIESRPETVPAGVLPPAPGKARPPAIPPAESTRGKMPARKPGRSQQVPMPDAASLQKQIADLERQLIELQVRRSAVQQEMTKLLTVTAPSQFRMVPLKFRDAELVANRLKELFGSRDVRIMADQRTNSVTIDADASTVEFLSKALSLIDVAETELGTPQNDVPVLNKVPHLNRLFKKDPKGAGDQSTFFIELDSQEQSLIARDRQSGKVIWKAYVGGLVDKGSIKTDDGVVTFTHEGGRQTLLDGATGKILRTLEPDTKSPPQ